MPTVTFYQDLAKPNSTHIPTSSVASGDCVFKHPTDLYNPTIVFNGDCHNATSFSLLGKYYWVTKMVSVRDDVWEVTGKKNLLATYQGSIGLASAFIQYADTKDNYVIPDSRLGMESGNYTLYSQNVDCSDFISVNNTYVTVACCAIGCIEECLVTTTELNQILNPFVGASSTDIQKALGSGQEACINAIRGAFWLPLNYSGIGATTSGTIKFGTLDTGIPRRLSPSVIYRSPEKSISFAGFTDWRNVNATIELALPLYGNVSIPVESILPNLGTDSLMVVPTLYVRYYINLYSGDYTIEIYRKVASSGGGTQHLIVTMVSGNCAVTLPVGTTLNNAAPRMIGAMAGVVGGAMSGNWGGAIESTAEAYGILTQAVNTSKPTAISTGGGGCAYAYRENIAATFYGKIYTHSNPNDVSIKSTIGVPVMKMGTIAAITSQGSGSGFVQGQDIKLVGTMTEDERNQIETLFNQGIFYET